MDAIILAAGKGTRLRPYTQSVPKPLLAVQGRPILDWIVAALPNVDRLIVVVNYLAEQIEEYLHKQVHVGDWMTVRQAEPRGTGDALLACRGKVRSEKLLVLNGDDLVGRDDLARLARLPLGMLAHPVQTPQNFGILFLKPDGSLDRIVEKPQGLNPPQLANIGAYLFPAKVLDLTLPLSPRGEYEITDAVNQLAANHPFHVEVAKHWFPIGTVEAWQEAQQADLEAFR